MMTGYGRHFDRGGEKASRFGFTLIELLVVIAIISIISAIVSVSFLSIAREARLSSGTNVVIAAIGNARALAMKNNRLVLVVFRPRLLENRTQIVEIVTAQWTGESHIDKTPLPPLPTIVIDRFEPIEGVAVRRLPRGIKVAGPMYADSTTLIDVNGTQAGDLDSYWSTQAHLPSIIQSRPLDDKSEPAGRLIGIMFSPDGSTISVNAQSDASASYIDFDRDSMQRIQNVSYAFDPFDANTNPGDEIVYHFLDNDEPVVMIAPYLAVFDDEQFREFSDPASWTDSAAGTKQTGCEVGVGVEINVAVAARNGQYTRHTVDRALRGQRGLTKPHPLDVGKQVCTVSGDTDLRIAIGVAEWAPIHSNIRACNPLL
ncbi:MAG: prepilin-type N-terminal cleavage/methylation domain-containing protein [Planctomycetes bacterium]|nr:prepilin-type N-terminal cleavage/methylation domain-containing protein [Planctomycetota bacterium]